jgi:NAD(P)-dependent dehydrogenase (short-subunit alcohol dehydrogenase family)
MDLRLNGQTAIVTGASRGIGLAVTRGLVAEGVHVTAGALKSSAELDELAGAGLVLVVEVDLAEPGGPARLVAAAGDRIDILVNNVGAAPARPGGFGEITDEESGPDRRGRSPETCCATTSIAHVAHRQDSAARPRVPTASPDRTRPSQPPGRPP